MSEQFILHFPEEEDAPGVQPAGPQMPQGDGYDIELAFEDTERANQHHAYNADLYLVDGNNLVHRAFHAVPKHFSRKSDGLPTNALFGFTSMLFKLLTEFQPKALAVAWDTRPKHRLEISEAYKAHRKPMDDMLKQQFPHFEPIVDAFGFKNVHVEGWEADDVLATLAHEAAEVGIKACVVTNDRDAYQLVCDSITVMATPKGIGDPVVYTPDKVLEKYGIGPELVTDFLGLKGDPGDGIPGVPKVGEKTATALLQEHGSLEAVLAAAPTMKPGKLRDNLIEFADQARESKVLATVKRDLDCGCSVQELLAATQDRSQLRTVLASYDFNAFARQLAEVE